MKDSVSAVATGAMVREAPTAPADRLMTIGEVAYRLGTSPSTINRRIQAGKFPKPVHLGTRTSRWRESEVNAWIQNLTQ
jgi:prophage regulatory protein